MKKQILNIGKTLSKIEQQTINGGWWPFWDCSNMTCQCNDGTKVWPYEDSPTEAEWEYFTTVEC